MDTAKAAVPGDDGLRRDRRSWTPQEEEAAEDDDAAEELDDELVLGVLEEPEVLGAGEEPDEPEVPSLPDGADEDTLGFDVVDEPAPEDFLVLLSVR